MRNNKKKKSLMLLLVLVLGVTIGYAILTTTLNINGTTKVKNATWNIYWDNPVVQAGSISTTTPTIDTNKTTASFNVTLNNPGDFYEFTIDAKNDGTIDGMISNISYKLNNTEISEENKLPTYLNYTVTYGDDTALEVNHFLKANTKETYKVRIEFKKDIENNELPGEEVDLDLKFAVTYVQADNNGVAVRTPTGVQTLIGKSSSTTNTKELVAIQHAATAQVPATTDYRYMGANPNNYILFNCDSDNPEEQNQSTCETWRIIGVIDNKIKILNTDNSISWDFENSSYISWDENGNNDWSNSTLYSLLNNEYYNSLKESAKSKIADSTWYLGGWGKEYTDFDGYYRYEFLGNYGQTAEGAYVAERSNEVYENNNTNVNGKIGLIYPSDAGFSSSSCYSTCTATSFSGVCSYHNGIHDLWYAAGDGFSLWAIEDEEERNRISDTYPFPEEEVSYGNEICRNSSWLNVYGPSITVYNGDSSWNYGYYSMSGIIVSGISNVTENADFNTISLYLKQSVNLTGTGTQQDPYKIS